jgi:hypothetical protein
MTVNPHNVSNFSQFLCSTERDDRKPVTRMLTMHKNKRTAVRQPMGTKAWIRFDGGFSVRQCHVANLSSTGVRIVVDEPRAVAERFSLLLKRDAGPGRRCRVKWRRGSEIGAEFVGV